MPKKKETVVEFWATDDWVEVRINDKIVFENHSLHAIEMAAIIKQLPNVRVRYCEEIEDTDHDNMLVWHETKI